MNFLDKKLILQKSIKKHFPYHLINYCYAYGSAVIPQKDNKGKMIDLFFVVDDLEKFHLENLKMNYDHYSHISKTFGIQTLLTVNQKGTCVYYNPNIKLDDNLLIKYGVMSVSDFKFQLKNWDNLFVSGRFHKPVSSIELHDDNYIRNTNENDQEIEKILYKNRLSALSLCALKNKKEINTIKFFVDLAKLSYIGDIRTYLKAEKKHKIKNVVLGALDSYLQLYKQMFNDFNVRKREEMLIFDDNYNEKFFDNIPTLFLTNLRLHAKEFQSREEYKDYFLHKLSVDKRREIIDYHLQRVNLKYSIYGVLSGMYSTNTSDSLIYMIEKYKKVLIK